MNLLSLFSGVGGMDLGLERAGMTVVGMCEIDKHARSVLTRHWPDVPIHDDVTTLETEQWRGRVDIVAGGSPCQDLSVAGRRKGLDGARSGLFWHQCRIADSVAAPWILWENVAGALTSSDGADFAAVLWGITGAHPRVPDGGWRSAGVIVGPKRWAVWRLLDAQYFGVAQRRRRVFVVGGPRGDCRPEVLLESSGMFGDSAPSRPSGEEVAGTIGTRPQRGDLDSHGYYIADLSGSLLARDSKDINTDDLDTKLIAYNKSQFAGYSEGAGSLCATQRQEDVLVVPIKPNVDAFSGGNLNGWRQGIDTLRAAGGDLGGGSETLVVSDVACTDLVLAPTLTAANNPSRSPQSSEITQQVEAVHSTGNGVRRLTPRECERLMGWPDDWTRYRADGAEQADSHRYKQCGNGVVSNVAEWIGRRIKQTERETTT